MDHSLCVSSTVLYVANMFTKITSINEEGFTVEISNSHSISLYNMPNAAVTTSTLYNKI